MSADAPWWLNRRGPAGRYRLCPHCKEYMLPSPGVSWWDCIACGSMWLNPPAPVDLAPVKRWLGSHGLRATLEYPTT